MWRTGLEGVHLVCVGLDLPGPERLLLSVPVVGAGRAEAHRCAVEGPVTGTSSSEASFWCK
jgi:hypothetical protein